MRIETAPSLLTYASLYRLIACKYRRRLIGTLDNYVVLFDEFGLPSDHECLHCLGRSVCVLPHIEGFAEGLAERGITGAE